MSAPATKSTGFDPVGPLVAVGVLGLFGVIIFLGLRASRGRGRKITQEWKAALAPHGLSVDGEWPSMSVTGSVQGLTVRLAYRPTGSGSKRRRPSAVCRASVAIPAHLGDLAMKPQGPFSLGKDVQLGDESFDPYFKVGCSDSSVARRVLNAEARGAILRTSASTGGVLSIEGGALCFEGPQPGDPSGAPKLATELVQLAGLLARA
jgi:hypothetical protein